MDQSDGAVNRWSEYGILPVAIVNIDCCCCCYYHYYYYHHHHRCSCSSIFFLESIY
jgi:hypothetical protein